MTTVRCILVVANYNNWKVYQLDVNNTFLHGDLHEEVFMFMLEGVQNPHNKVCILKKSLYCLKQASTQWYTNLLEELKLLHFVQSKNDYLLFTKVQKHSITILVVYIDELLSIIYAFFFI